MLEQRIQSATIKKFDDYLRREDTPIAQFVHIFSQTEGDEYRDSLERKILETTISSLSLVLALPLILLLATIVKLESEGPAFFKHQRVDRDGEFYLWKIRTMTLGAENFNDTARPESKKPESDPRNTNIGKILRKYEFEELPQLIQVLLGRLRLVGLRAASPRADSLMKQDRPQSYQHWQTEYNKERGSLFSLNSVFNHSATRKNPKHRYHFDIFYSKKMSLKLDLYILIRSVLNNVDEVLVSRKRSNHSKTIGETVENTMVVIDRLE